MYYSNIYYNFYKYKTRDIYHQSFAFDMREKCKCNNYNETEGVKSSNKRLKMKDLYFLSFILLATFLNSHTARYFFEKKKVNSKKKKGSI